MSQSTGLVAHGLMFQLSPIILTGGVADFLGGMLPIIALTEAVNFTQGLLGGGDLSLENAFANFRPLPGGTMVNTQYGKYPFANQQVAANAAISQPNVINMLMVCPARPNIPWTAKLAIMTALQATIATHVNSGGTFTVATPSYVYTNCLLNSLTDTTPDNPQQPQSQFTWQFEQPLLTEAQAFLSYNGSMQKLVSAVPSTGALSGAQVIASPLSLAAPSMFPSASNQIGTSTASYFPL